MNRHVSRFTRIAGGAMVVTAIAPWLGGIASATVGTPTSGDPRATAYAGNIHDSESLGTACAQIGLPNDTEVGGDANDGYDAGGLTITNDGTYMDLTAVPDGQTVDAIIIKGGNDSYNVYGASNFTAGPPVNDMHGP